MSGQFRDGFYALVPPWLATGNGEKYMYTLETMRDLLMEKANQAVKIRMPGQGDASQIPFLAFDRQLVQGPLESNASFVLRLQGAIPAWNLAGSALSILVQLQAYAQGIQSIDAPMFAIVSDPRSSLTTWWTLDYDDPVGTPPLQSTVPVNFDWDSLTAPASTWRAWLVLYQNLDAPTLSGIGASISAAGGGSFVLADIGENVDGVWVPKTSGTPLNAPFLTVIGLVGLLPEHVGSILTISGSGAGNDGAFQVVQVLDDTSCVIASKAGAVEGGSLTWTLATYPWMPPALAWGSPGQVWGDGEGATPPVDTGSNVGGVWRPTTIPTTGESPTYAWGVRIDPLELETIRGLVRAWKSGGTYYPNFVICYDGVNIADPSDAAYSRLAAPGGGNPDGTFGEVGHYVAGVWVPTRLIASPFDCYVQGTGRAVACTLENIT